MGLVKGMMWMGTCITVEPWDYVDVSCECFTSRSMGLECRRQSDGYLFSDEKYQLYLHLVFWASIRCVVGTQLVTYVCMVVSVVMLSWHWQPMRTCNSIWIFRIYSCFSLEYCDFMVSRLVTCAWNEQMQYKRQYYPLHLLMNSQIDEKTCRPCYTHAGI